MNITLWVLQVLGALLYAASGVMKAFLFDKISHDVPSFGALPRRVWQTLGGVELICVLGLIVPPAIHWQPVIMVFAAAILALESLLFIWVHIQYREVGAIVMCSVLGLLMAFLAYGRLVLHPFV